MRLRPPAADLPASSLELLEYLQHLHHLAGRPSCRLLAREVGCSRQTVHSALTGPQIARWGLVELLVEELRGDRVTVHQLWLRATA